MKVSPCDSACFRWAAIGAAFCLAASAALAQLVVPPPLVAVTPEKARGVYEVGEPIVWKIEWKGGNPVTEASYVLKRGGLTETGRGALQFKDNVARLETKLDAPGAVLADITVKDAAGGEQLGRGGAIAAPAEIKPAVDRPADFDEFWAAKVAEIKAVPPNPQIEKKDSGVDGVDYYHVTLDGYRGTHIHGQLARPSEVKAGKDAKLPALFIPQWAGVYPLEKAWAVDRAKEGWLVLNVIAHDIPIQKPVEFYAQQDAGPLKDYWFLGNDDRETSYFLRMYLSCLQSMDYLTSRPDWNGKVLAVSGGSQGGMQTFVSAALNPKVTAALAIVPAGCDLLGGDVGRDAGWPKWMNGAAGKNRAKVREASRYFDVVNFASRIKCPMLVGYGLIDDTCPPEGIAAALNQVKSPKEIVVCPAGGHVGVAEKHKEYMDRCYSVWLPALAKGEPAHVNKK